MRSFQTRFETPYFWHWPRRVFFEFTIKISFLLRAWRGVACRGRARVQRPTSWLIRLSLIVIERASVVEPR